MSKGSLKKELGLLDVFSIALGAMISSGLFPITWLFLLTGSVGAILSGLPPGLLIASPVIVSSSLLLSSRTIVVLSTPTVTVAIEIPFFLFSPK